MNYNRIDVLEDHGTIWQGGKVDDDIESKPFAGPLMIVTMDKGEEDEKYIDHKTVECVLNVWIKDKPKAVLADNVLITLAKTIITWLQNGNVYLHCSAGVSRSSYLDVAVHCIALNIGADDALALIREKRWVADPNEGFMEQLRRLFPETQDDDEDSQEAE